MNFLIVGGTGTGKTTLLNALCRLIPRDQRVGILEDTPEIRFEHPDVFRNQARPANAEGEGEVTIRDLVINSLRKRPDRIIVGECRGPEAFDMLRAISSGHLGSITTIHANDARGAMPALLNMVQQAGMGMEAKDILDYVSRCFDFVVAIERGTDGQRRITEIAEIQGMEGDKVRMGTIVKFEQDWTDGLQIEGTWVPTGEANLPGAHLPHAQVRRHRRGLVVHVIASYAAIAVLTLLGLALLLAARADRIQSGKQTGNRGEAAGRIERHSTEWRLRSAHQSPRQSSEPSGSDALFSPASSAWLRDWGRAP